jgi:hypothetical protein
MSYAKIAILEDSNLKEFVSREFKLNTINEEKIKIEEIIDRYSIRRLPGNYSDKLQKIVVAVDNYFVRSSRDGLHKLRDFEVKLTKLNQEELDELYKALTAKI